MSAGARPAEAITPGLRASLGHRRAWIAIAAVLVAGAVLLVVLQGAVRPPGAPLASDNAAPDGAQALVRVLEAGGVEVEAVRSLDAAIDAGRGRATVFLHDDAGLLDRDRIRELAGSVDRIVVARPDFAALEVLAPGVRLAGGAPDGLDEAACTLAPAERAGGLSAGQQLLGIDDEAAAAGFEGCFASGDAFAVVAGPSPHGAEVVLVGSVTPFANATIDEAGNAALAIGLLGSGDRLVWYLPGPGDADAADAPTLGELMPGWASPLLVLLVLVTIAAGVRSGRRFGPLVFEDLPVDVPASETGEGRARLYARGSARGRALDQLRIATIRRLATMLRLPRAADVDAVAAAAAGATGLDAASVRTLLVDAEPHGDRDLVRLANELDDLERRTRAALSPDPARAAPPTTGRRP
ncbi:DUF4350 domain-containing protein [Agromyces marinus]|uniref:DUF4350 domain-containing protein n=1 Tax=Agromyces marinus TaxID=1389020 RepID=UPI001F235C62|nr:DUF4350 domain-containing protein [Agromyces marinus]UIP58073.1 putative membrane protein [Agromyces marinus]